MSKEVIINMTRGQIAIIRNGENNTKEILTSVEFNGDMYPPTKNWKGHGQEVVNALRRVNDTANYQFEVAKFNNKHHHYNDRKLIYDQKIETLDFTKDYFENWFSDYIYIKNITKDVVTLTTQIWDKNGNTIGKETNQLFPGQIARIYFGKLQRITE